MENVEREELLLCWKELLEAKSLRVLKNQLAEANEVDVAEFMEELPLEKTVLIFRVLPKEMASDVFANLEPERQQAIISAATDREVSELVEDLYVDDAVDMLEELPASVVKRVLKTAKPETRKLINQFLNYPENSVGSIMTAELIDLKKDMTVQQAIAAIRSGGADSESIYTCYVTGSRRTLEGVVTLRELLLAPDEAKVEELMSTDIITALTTEDQEEAVQRLMKYDFISLPVVDQEGRLVGIVTVDDVMDVMEEEATEDFEKMAAMTPSEKPYLKTSVLALAKNRILWLMVLMLSSMFTGSILGHYEAAFAAVPILVTFIPMLTGTGGNAGSQSSTTIIRGMAVGEIELRDFPRVLWKELRVSLLVGLLLSLVNFLRLALFTCRGNIAVSLTVALATMVTVVAAKTIGSMLPMLAKCLHLDPALMASPLISTIVDAVSLVVYFTLAGRLLSGAL